MNVFDVAPITLSSEVHYSRHESRVIARRDKYAELLRLRDEDMRVKDSRSKFDQGAELNTRIRGN